MNNSMSAQGLIATALDQGSFSTWDEPLVDPPKADSAYVGALKRARHVTGLDESVLTGEGTIAGRRVAVVALEFAFLGGTVGVASAERLVRAFERATAERLPLFASLASGGTRMQEGALASRRWSRWARQPWNTAELASPTLSTCAIPPQEGCSRP